MRPSQGHLPFSSDELVRLDRKVELQTQEMMRRERAFSRISHVITVFATAFLTCGLAFRISLLIGVGLIFLPVVIYGVFPEELDGF